MCWDFVDGDFNCLNKPSLDSTEQHSLLQKHQTVRIGGFKYLLAWKFLTLKLPCSAGIRKVRVVRDEIMCTSQTFWSFKLNHFTILYSWLTDQPYSKR